LLDSFPRFSKNRHDFANRLSLKSLRAVEEAAAGTGETPLFAISGEKLELGWVQSAKLIGFSCGWNGAMIQGHKI
jgi:hypothetical protein